MRHAIRIHRPQQKAILSMILVLTLVMSLFSAVLASPAAAKSVRSAVVTSVTGDVTYTKAGGSRSISVYPELSLNQGDLIVTGPGASVVLNIVDRNDEVTIGENAEVYISELMDDGGKKSKIKTWAGSVWSKVKSIVSSEDEFEVDTPTAVMGVRGTHFFVSINPATGNAYLAVGSGIVQTSQPGRDGTDSGSDQQSRPVNIYPAQQIHVDFSTPSDLGTGVDYIDLETLVQQASPTVIEQMLRSMMDIRSENELLRSKLEIALAGGERMPDGHSTLSYANQEELDRIVQNFDRLIPLLAKEAIDSRKIDQRLIDDINRQIQNPAQKLDLSKVTPFDKAAGLDPELEKQKQAEKARAEKERQAKLEAERKQLEENKKRLEQMLAKVEEDRKRIDEANRQAALEAAKKAEEAMKAQLSEAARKAFEENSKKNQQPSAPNTPNTPSRPTGSNDSDSGSSDSESVPGRPVLIAPAVETEAVVNEDVQVRLTAQSDSTVMLRTKSGQTLATSRGAGSSTPVTLTFKPASVGKLELEAVATNGAGTSSILSLPAITVIPAAPVLVSPGQAITANAGEPVIIKLKASEGTSIELSGQGSVLASAPGKGSEEVVFTLNQLPVGVHSLTAHAVQNGYKSVGKPLPSITINGTQPAAQPKVSLKQVGQAAGGQVQLQLEMENFGADQAFYGVQAHLQYDASALTYTGPTQLPDSGQTIFSGANSAETLNQKQPSAGMRELIFAGVRFQTAGTGTVPDIVLGQSPAKLVTIPLQIQSGAPAASAVKLLYVKVVNKQGHTVYELPLNSQDAISVKLIP
ncbi:FecR domain-containing protein [Paenibacillus puerhi]|uniref:FecR domain-containing protein n=1 Tax=Paenibacillus puerhi TaxID=2692622 RepID=UPI0013592B2C|nr:FecR domain-containing protein [Paenibacillus puerhi]